MVTVNDGDIDSAVATTTVNITAVDDLPVAQPDAFTINEDGVDQSAPICSRATAVGADSDPDGPPLSHLGGERFGRQCRHADRAGVGRLLTVNAERHVRL